MKKVFLLALLPAAFVLDWGIVNPFGWGMPLSASALAAVIILASLPFAPRMALAGALAGVFEMLSLLRPGVYAVIFLCWIGTEEMTRRLVNVKGFSSLRSLGLGLRMLGFACVAWIITGIFSFF